MWSPWSGNRLFYVVLTKKFLKSKGQVLRTAITVKNKAFHMVTTSNSLFESGSHKLCAIFLGYSMSDDFAGEQVENHAYVKIVAFDFKTGNVTDPNLIGRLSLESLLNLIIGKFRVFQSEIVRFGICTNTTQSVWDGKI